MSRREVTHFYDDLDHSLIPEDQLEVVRFSVNGQNYLIDLSTDNARHFHNLLAPYAVSYTHLTLPTILLV